MFKKLIYKIKERDRRENIRHLLRETKGFRRIGRTFLFRGVEYKIIKWNFKDFYHQLEFTEATPIVKVTNPLSLYSKTYDLREYPFNSYRGLKYLSSSIFTDKNHLYDFLDTLARVIEEDEKASIEVQIIQNKGRKNDK